MWDPTAEDETPGPPMPEVGSTPPPAEPDEDTVPETPSTSGSRPLPSSDSATPSAAPTEWRSGPAESHPRPASAFSVMSPPPAPPAPSAPSAPSASGSVTAVPILAEPKPPSLVSPSLGDPTPPPSDASAAAPARPPTRRRWPLVLLALATVVASGVVSWFVASEVSEEPTSTNAIPVVVEDIAEDSSANDSATPITGNTIAPTTLDSAPTGGISGEFLASEPFAAAAAKIAPSVVQLTLDNGLGSGVIIDERGYILTAAHVVGTTTELDVRLFDGSTVPGTVVGTHAPTDVAVVEIDGEGLDLVVAPLADGDDVRVGQLAVAVGSPFGFEQTVTAGIISAVDRVVNSVSMVQTDAPINPGNSGGPLIDLQGRVVGINDLIFTESGSNAGVGFAISIDLAMVVAEQLIAGEEVQLALLGVTSGPSPDGAAGALIEAIVEDSAAEDAGFEIGDLVISVDGVATRGSSSLRAQVVDNRPGTVLEFGIIRDGEPITLTATLGTGG